jgi:AmmeMemoRadiSam system protein B
MSIRKRVLPAGWYPRNAGEIRRMLAEWGSTNAETGGGGIAAIVPHAGWAYSGKLAFETLERLDAEVDTLVIVGGHLPRAAGLYYAPENGFETPLGTFDADVEFLDELLASVGGEVRTVEDTFADNTVEVQLPMLKYLFPQSRCVCLRCDPSLSAQIVGRRIADVAQEAGRTVRVIGSTDLTHYGSAYGFEPAGPGESGLSWAEGESDARIINAFAALDSEEALTASEEDRSACSVGGALVAISFARSQGTPKSSVVRYLNSYHVSPSDSFVGYVGIVYTIG